MNVTRKTWYETYRAFRSSEGRWNPWAEKRDPLAERQKLAQKISETAIDGVITFCVGGTDCDGCQWSSRFPIAATVTRYLREIEFQNDSADGPFGVDFRSPTNDELRRYSEDVWTGREIVGTSHAAGYPT